jgi:PPOX class probable FMN-dependent enzyme
MGARRCRPSSPAAPERAILGIVAATRAITDEDELREIIGSPTPLVAAKISDRLNDLTRQFIERSPFVCVATATPEGGLDVSPRGDPAGFVRILDERTLLLPDRPGNRIADTLTNLLADPRIALLFLIPGVGDTFRVNGRASIVDDPELLAPSSVGGKPPRLAILVAIDEAFTQCSKALVRSDLWNPANHIERSELPSSGEIMRAVADPQLDAGAYDRERSERYARGDGLY